MQKIKTFINLHERTWSSDKNKNKKKKQCVCGNWTGSMQAAPPLKTNTSTVISTEPYTVAILLVYLSLMSGKAPDTLTRISQQEEHSLKFRKACRTSTFVHTFSCQWKSHTAPISLLWQLIFQQPNLPTLPKPGQVKSRVWKKKKSDQHSKLHWQQSPGLLRGDILLTWWKHQLL